MNTKNAQKILVFLIPVLLLGFILFYSPKDTSNKRTVEERMIEEVDIDSYEPKIAVQENYSIETRETIEELTTETKSEGTGESTVVNGDTVQVFYRGWLANNGTVFDESTTQGSPFETPIGQGAVIQGWEFGIIGMKQGEVRRIFIPSSLAYGESEQGQIPANSDLIFDVELVAIN